MNALNSLPTDDPVTAAYVHIPFCHRRCFYCDFPVKVIGDGRDGSNFPLVDHYLTQLRREIRATVNPSSSPLQTVFFGGGTPSLLTISQLGEVLHTLQQQFGFAEGLEISLELDPGTFDRPKLTGFQELGVNRFSLGVQAFQDSLLQSLGRSHTLAQVYEAIELFHQHAIRNWSLDLISGLPQQTLAHWEESLAAAIDAHPTHLSLYDLVLEPQTVFARREAQGHLPLPPEELSATFYRHSQQRLGAAGYEHYEISNYAKPGFACRHNQVYWHNQPYYGFGMGATSYLYQRRVPRPRILQEYEHWVDRYCQQGLRFWSDYEAETPTDRFLETLMLGLRLREGVDLNRLDLDSPQRFTALCQALAPYESQGWIRWIPQNDRLYPRLQLQDPEGFLFSNQVLSALFALPES